MKEAEIHKMLHSNHKLILAFDHLVASLAASFRQLSTVTWI